MKRPSIGWLAMLAIVCGCGQAGAPVAANRPATGLTNDQLVASLSGSALAPFPEPDFTRSSNLALIADDGSQVHVGDEIQSFKSSFPRSAKTSRSLDGQLPVGASEDHWSVTGWEFENSSRGVGALLFNNRIAVAMRQFDDVDPQFVNNEVAKYQAEFGLPANVQTAHVHYWLWESPSSTLMICQFTDNKNQTNLTTAVGETTVMERLHMTLATAQEDSATVERLYGGQAADSPTNTQ